MWLDKKNLIARNCRTMLACPKCDNWVLGEPDDFGIVRGRCGFCKLDLAWGHEQDIERGTFKGKSWIE